MYEFGKKNGGEKEREIKKSKNAFQWTPNAKRLFTTRAIRSRILVHASVGVRYSRRQFNDNAAHASLAQRE